MDDQIAQAMQQAGAGAPAFAPPPGMGPPSGPPAAPPGPPAPLPGATPDDAGLVPVPEAEVETPDEVDDELGSGARPRQSGSTVRRKEHPLERAAQTLGMELRGNAQRLASDLFPSGPAGSERLSAGAFNAYVARHWDEPEFRQSLLERMAPKGPDGKRLPSGVKQFNALYKDVVSPAQRLKNTPSSQEAPAFVPPGQAQPQAAPAPVPPPMGQPGQPTAPAPMPGPPPPPPGPPPTPPPAPPGMPASSPPPMPPPGLEGGMPPPPGPNVLPPG
jgi:hypothetical protein